MKIWPKSLPFSISKQARPVVIFCAGLLILIIVVQIPFFSKVREHVQHAGTIVGTRAGNVWQRVFESGESVHAQKEHYRELSEALATEQSYIAELESQVRELQTLLGYKQSVDHETVTARIIARAPEGQQTLLIDKGKRDGFTNGLPVIAEGGHLIGTILIARDKTSVVRLLSDQSSSVPATVLSAEKTLGLVEGEDGFLFHMAFIPQEEEITIHDVVVTSGLSQNMPANLVIGIVAKVIKNETAPFQEARIEPLVDLRNISHVLVIQEISSL